MTVYAQIKDKTVLKFPYTMGDLMAENPFTRFDPNEDLVSIFSTTNLAIENNLQLVEVEYLSEPNYDAKTQKLVRAELPGLQDDKWIYEWVVSEKTPEEINFAAIKPIIKQIRLRQLSGNILIDFVRFHQSARKKLLQEFESCLKDENPQSVKVIGWSHLGF